MNPLQKKTFFLLLILIFFAFSSFACEKSTAPVNNPQVTLTAEYVGVTEAELVLKTENTEANTQYQLFRDDSLVNSGTLLQLDTTILDTLLFPAQSYKYRAQLLKDGNPVAYSQPVQITTMDTTSHDFTWETFTFGTTGSSVLHDVAIINENDIWATGDINASGGPYNAVHWDGQQWELKRIPFTGWCSAVEFPPIISIFAFSENDIWFARGGSLVHYDGNSFYNDCAMNALLNGSINEIWGTDSNNMFIVGSAGSIVYCNGSNWKKIESETDVDLLDVWGSSNDDRVWACGWKDFKPTVLIKIENQKAEKVYESRNKLFSYDPDSISGAIYSVWVDEFKHLYALTNYDLYRCKPSTKGEGKAIWKKNDPYIWASRSVRGTSLNNIVSVGYDGLIWHFNGKDWEHFPELINTADRLRSVSAKGNIIAVAGYRYINPVEIYGIIYLGRR